MGEFVSLDVADGIGTIRLDRPPLNALDVQMQEELLDVAAQAEQDEAVRAVVVYGGERAFAAGADIRQMLGMSYADMSARATALSRCLGSVSGIGKPVVAAIAGYALGGGCEVALACDWRVAAADAKLGLPEVALGVIPGGGGTQRLARLVGPARAKDLILTGRTVDAPEALAIGLVDRVLPPGQSVYDAAVEVVRRYVGGPALAIRAAKAAIDAGLEMDLERGLAWESQLFTGLFATQDRTEGMTAFLEKRGPRFTGR